MTYREWTKIDLREELRDRGLSRAGSRQELVDRLRQHDQLTAAAAPGEHDEGQELDNEGQELEDEGQELELELPAPAPPRSDELERSRTPDHPPPDELPDDAALDEVVAEVAQLDVPGIAEEVANRTPADREVPAGETPGETATDQPVAKDEEQEPPPPLTVARRAVEALTQLTGRRPDGISGLRPLGGGWRLEIEVVEVSRGPAETDVLDTYEVVVDTHGGVERYDRIRRYVRGKSWEGGDVH